MKRLLFNITVILLFVFCLVGTAGAATYYDSLSSFTSMNSLIPDWQFDYFEALKPGELDLGEYRLTTAYGKMDSEYEGHSFYGDVDMDPWGMMLNFDTAFEKDIYFNMSYTYVPEYKDYEEDKNKSNLYSLTLTHLTKNDNQIFFGYSNSKTEIKNYLSGTDEYEQSVEEKNKTFYIGAEIRGSFPFTKK